MRNERLRLPFHDSISVCVGSLSTTATIELSEALHQDSILVNGKGPMPDESARINIVVDKIRKMAGDDRRYRLCTKNNLSDGKGLGFSASAFAAIGLATSRALGLALPVSKLSEIVRLGSGSSARSLVGGVAIWYANRRGRSYSEQLTDSLDLGMVIVPLASDVKTAEAHRESVTSPFFNERLRYLRKAIKEMRDAVKRRDVAKICMLAEVDSLNLHALTMTGESGLTLFAPETIKIIRLVRELREKRGLPVWYSLDTGPSVFVNTVPDYAFRVSEIIEGETGLKTLVSEIGSQARIVGDHLF